MFASIRLRINGVEGFIGCRVWALRFMDFICSLAFRVRVSGDRTPWFSVRACGLWMTGGLRLCIEPHQNTIAV